MHPGGGNRRRRRRGTRPSPGPCRCRAPAVRTPAAGPSRRGGSLPEGRTAGLRRARWPRPRRQSLGRRGEPSRLAAKSSAVPSGRLASAVRMESWTDHSVVMAALGRQAAIPLALGEGLEVAHSRTIGVRTPDPERTFELRPLKVRMGWRAALGLPARSGRFVTDPASYCRADREGARRRGLPRTVVPRRTSNFIQLGAKSGRSAAARPLALAAASAWSMAGSVGSGAAKGSPQAVRPVGLLDHRHVAKVGRYLEALTVAGCERKRDTEFRQAPSNGDARL